MNNVKKENCNFFLIVSQNAKPYYLFLKKFFINIAFATIILLIGCVNTEGILKIKGKVIDEYTKVSIPGREIIVQGLLESNNKLVPIDAGRFSTDSSGCFKYKLTKVKDAHFYNFCFVGDSDYAFMTKKLGLIELEKNKKYLFFSLSKLVDLTIKIQKKSKTPFRDTLYLSLESNRVDFRTLYPYKIDNYGITDNAFGFIPGFGLRWIGGNINSTVKTRVFADKMTKIHWELVSNKKRKEITDTLTCRRGIVYVVILNIK
jgi:hypothetical protein